VLEEAAGEPSLVFVQDYHFALLPHMLKAARPDLVVAQFWHVPWPHPETFQVCPWAAEIVRGMLGNDLLAFQTQHHCNNFLDTVDRTVECRIDRDRFVAVCGGHETLVRPYPISVDPDLADEYLGPAWARRAAAVRRRHRLGDRPLLVGVDRVDYTKGIPERLTAVERLLDTRPELRGTFHFVQLGAPSRTHLTAYRDLNDRVQALADRINWRHGTPGWQPVVFLNEHQGPEDVYLLYRMAAGCVVSSLHDGMNLVAKEFVAARTDDRGVLVLSKFAGAARELADAVLVNPVDTDELAAGLHQALIMPDGEQERRMRRLRAQVADQNIYRWAGTLLSEVGRLAGTVAAPADPPTPSPIGARPWMIST
jgi:trehalose 6-phosphate synthase